MDFKLVWNRRYNGGCVKNHEFAIKREAENCKGFNRNQGHFYQNLWQFCEGKLQAGKKMQPFSAKQKLKFSRKSLGNLMK